VSTIWNGLGFSSTLNYARESWLWRGVLGYVVQEGSGSKFIDTESMKMVDALKVLLGTNGCIKN